MRDFTVMTTIGLKLLSNEAKKLTKAVFDMSKKILRTCLRVQYNAAIFPIYFVYGGLKYVYKQSYNSDNIKNVSILEPKSDDVVNSVKKLRQSLILGMKGISSSRCDTKVDSISLNNDSVRDEEGNVNLSEDQLYGQIPDVALETGCSTTETTIKNPQVVYLNMKDFTGNDIMWDIPIISAKTKYFAQCLKEGKKEKVEEARTILDQHSINNQMPVTRQEYDKMLHEVRNGVEYFAKSSLSNFDDAIEPTKTYKDCPVENQTTASNILKTQYRQNKEFRYDDDAAFPHSTSHKKTKYQMCDPWLTQGKILRREMATINRKLTKIHTTCSSLLRGLSCLNEDLNKVVLMKEKLTRLEFQVDEGNKLLQEVECDRSAMKSKLSALEKLINEEEAFLYDVSCESGFYESENNTGNVSGL